MLFWGCCCGVSVLPHGCVAEELHTFTTRFTRGDLGTRAGTSKISQSTYGSIATAGVSHLVSACLQ